MPISIALLVEPQFVSRYCIRSAGALQIRLVHIHLRCSTQRENDPKSFQGIEEPTMEEPALLYF